MPHEGEVTATDWMRVDVHFAIVMVSPRATARRDEIIAAIEASPIDKERLRGGPSYIELGGALGDQGLALQLLGLGQAVGLWKVITPKRFGFEGPEADTMAGSGLVMASGYHPEVSALPG